MGRPVFNSASRWGEPHSRQSVSVLHLVVMKARLPVQFGNSVSDQLPLATNSNQTGSQTVFVHCCHHAKFHFGRREYLPIELGCLLCWFVTTSVTAQKSEPPMLVASVSVATVPSKVQEKSLREPATLFVVRLPEDCNAVITEPPHVDTEEDVWEKFEAEYRPQQPSSSLVMRNIESAKYCLDFATFGFSRLIKNIRDSAVFKFDQGQLCRSAPDNSPPTRSSGNSWTDGLKDVRVKLDFSPRVGEPYIGVRVVIPFGN